MDRGEGSIARNAVALYAVQGAALLLPLITLPYLARVLEPDGWGLVVFAQAFGVWISLVLQFGFAFSATRSVAQNRGSASRLSEIVQGVLSAKLVLLALLAAVGIVSWAVVPLFRSHPAFLVWAWAAAVLQGFAPLWFFQGIEQLRGAAAVDVAAKALATVAIFVLVKGPAHGWMVLALRAAAELVSTAVMTLWMYRKVRFVGWSGSAATRTLRASWPLFVFSGAASIYTSSNPFILGLFTTTREVAFYGAADRVVRAASTLLSPLSQAIYPRISHLLATEAERAGRLIRQSVVPFVAMGSLLGIALFVLAPWITAVAFGSEYAPTVSVIRILALLPPLLGVGTVLGIHWALPHGFDRFYMRFVVAAGVANILLALILVPRLGSNGMAVSAVLAEALVEVGLVWLFVRKGGWSGSSPGMQPDA